MGLNYPQGGHMLPQLSRSLDLYLAAEEFMEGVSESSVRELGGQAERARIRFSPDARGIKASESEAESPAGLHPADFHILSRTTSRW